MSLLMTLALPLAELEPLPGALPPVLLALFAARVASYQTLGLQLAPQLRIELHQGPRNAELHRVSLPAHSTAQHVGDHVKRGCGIGGRQRCLRRRTLRRSHEILLKLTPVHFEIAAAGTQINARNSSLPPTRSVVLN